MWNLKVLFLLYFIETCFANYVCETVNPIDPAQYQLETFRQCSKRPVGYITTSTGQPVDIRDTNTLNTNLLLNNFFLDTLSHSNSERIPERMVHAKGTGAFGYFEVTNDITDYCNANMFNAVGKKTPVAVRFSNTIPSIGGSDLVRDSRGVGIKFYTDEGNLDLIGINTPIFTFRDPGVFAHHFHSNKDSPVTNLLDHTAKWDFVVLRPEAIFQTLWIFSDYGLPNGYRHMPFFPIHTYEVVNNKGESHFIRFNFTSNQGIENLSSEEAKRIGAIDSDYFVRDLYNAIENKRYPTWTLYIDILSKNDIEHSDFDPFDLTRLWPLNSYKTISVGRLVLNRNPLNHFAEIEQLALCPCNLVPGVLAPPDKLFQGRVIAYRNTQNHRLGFNHNNILVNQPKYKKTYNRDGGPPVGDNMKNTPNYYPNSFNGPIPVVDINRQKRTLTIFESNAVDLEPANDFYTRILNKSQRQRLIDNLVANIATAIPSVQKRTVDLLYNVNTELGREVAEGLQYPNVTFASPKYVLYG